MKNFVRKALPFLALFIFISCTSNVASKGSITIKFGSAREAVDHSDLTVSLVLTYPDATKSDPVILKEGDVKTFAGLEEGTYSIYAKAYKVDAENPDAEPETLYEYNGEPFFLEAGETHPEPVVLKAVPKKTSKVEETVDEPADDTGDDEPVVETGDDEPEEETSGGDGSGSTGTSKPEEEKKPSNTPAINETIIINENKALPFSEINGVYQDAPARYRANIDLSEILKGETINTGDTVVFTLTSVCNYNLPNLNYQLAYMDKTGEDTIYDVFYDSYGKQINLNGTVQSNTSFSIKLPLNALENPDSKKCNILQLYYDKYVNGEEQDPITLSNCTITCQIYRSQQKYYEFIKHVESKNGTDYYLDDLSVKFEKQNPAVSLGDFYEVTMSCYCNKDVTFTQINVFEEPGVDPWWGWIGDLKSENGSVEPEQPVVLKKGFNSDIKFIVYIYGSANFKFGENVGLQFLANTDSLGEDAVYFSDLKISWEKKGHNN